MTEEKESAWTERRRDPRFPATLPMDCRKDGRPLVSLLEIRNISVGGLAFLSYEPFEVGDHVVLSFPLLTFGEEVQGTVRWTTRMSDATPCAFLQGIQYDNTERHYYARLVEEVCHIESYREEQESLHHRSLTGEEAAIEWEKKYGATFRGEGA